MGGGGVLLHKASEVCSYLPILYGNLKDIEGARSCPYLSGAYKDPALILYCIATF